MDALARKKIAAVSKYIAENFSLSDWYMLGQITGKSDLITGHGRLLRSHDFGDPDYPAVTIEVLNSIFARSEHLIDEVIDHFDIDLWYQQKEPAKFQKLFLDRKVVAPDFWRMGYLRAFVSHLSSDRERMSYLKTSLQQWGIYAFIAHEDIQPTREWRNEVEAALDTMDVLIAVVQPGFKESDWCSQEVGYALGRKIEIVPVKAGLDPFGFFGKYQAIPAKGRLPSIVSQEIVLTILLTCPPETGVA